MLLTRSHLFKMMKILNHDLADRLELVDRYALGKHNPPYMPRRADAEYRLLADRCVNNWMPLVINSAAQTLRWDGYKRGGSVDQKVDATNLGAEYVHMQKCRMDSRQEAVIRGALTYGHSFTVTEIDPRGNKITRGLSALRTSALFADATNDIAPELMFTVTKFPDGEIRGEGLAWDEKWRYKVYFKSLTDEEGFSFGNEEEHGLPECPGTRHAPFVDLDGRTMGLIEPLIPLQDRINQTTFDLLVAQTYSSFEVRTATGMLPPVVTEPVYEDEDDPNSEVVGAKPVIDPDTGQPVTREIDLNPMRLLMTENPNARFGSLPGGNLNGFIDSLDMHVRHFAAQSQTPPHYLLGQMANLSAEALNAAEKSLHRLVDSLKITLGESFERDFRLAAYLAGEMEVYNDHGGQVNWIDAESHSMSMTLDALVKAKELGIPERGLWKRFPDVTQTELAEWEKMAESDPNLMLATSLDKAREDRFGRTGSSEPSVPSRAS